MICVSLSLRVSVTVCSLLLLNSSSSVQIPHVCFRGRWPQHPGRHGSGQGPRWWQYNIFHNGRQRGRKLHHWQPERWYLIFCQDFTFAALSVIDSLSVKSHIQFSLIHFLLQRRAMNVLNFQSHWGKKLRVDIESCRRMCGAFFYFKGISSLKIEIYCPPKVHQMEACCGQVRKETNATSHHVYRQNFHWSLLEFHVALMRMASSSNLPREKHVCYLLFFDIRVLGYNWLFLSMKHEWRMNKKCRSST